MPFSHLKNKSIKEFLKKSLSKWSLQEVAYDYGLKDSGTKEKLAERIIKSGLPVEEIFEEYFDEDDLEDICKELNIPYRDLDTNGMIRLILNKLNYKDAPIPKTEIPNKEIYLAGYLNSKGYKIKQEAGETRVDILVNFSIPIELKKNLTQSGYDRLIGQGIRHIRSYGNLIVVICDTTRRELFEDFEHIINSRFSGEFILIRK